MSGRNGFARTDEKREGDGKTPAGTFSLESAFGYAPDINTRLVYRQATKNDIWVDDPASGDYNKWVRKGETTASSFEEMKRNDNLYRYGIVTGYNLHPVIKGRGSAIFLHVWRGKGKPTAGCIAMAEKDIIEILAWLDPSKQPVIVIDYPEDRKQSATSP